jgi:hypothetical protein
VHETLTTTNRLLSTAGNTEVEETVPRTGVGLSNDVPMGLRDGRGRGGGVTRTASTIIERHQGDSKSNSEVDPAHIA